MYTIENIPAKIFFKIQETNNITLLCNKKKPQNELLKAWEDITTKAEEYTNNKNKSKVLNISAKIQSLTIQLQAVSTTLYLLKANRNIDLENKLRAYGYTLTEENYYNDLKEIERLYQSLNTRIGKFKADLKRLQPQQKETVQKQTFEDAFISVLAVLEFGLKDANTITYLEFLALEKQATQKIEAMQKVNEKK